MQICIRQIAVNTAVADEEDEERNGVRGYRQMDINVYLRGGVREFTRETARAGRARAACPPGKSSLR